MTAYNLRFSSPLKNDVIEVKGVDVSSGLNISDTSLELVGNGYPDYARAISQNFLKLLENFASPFPPENPIEGQFWFDTSDPSRKILKINNGSLSSARWQPAGEIFRQPTDPALGYPSTVNDGVLWADTSTQTLKMKTGNSWSQIGPTASIGSAKTGSEYIFLRDSTDTFDVGVILNWSNGSVVEIISKQTFIPQLSISGFSTIKAGVNLSSQISAKYNGIAEKSLALQASNGKIYLPENFLKSSTTSEQIHTGTFVVESINGLFVKNKEVSKSINFYNNALGSFIKTVNSDSSLTISSNQSYIKINGLYNNIGINTSTSSASSTLSVNGSGSFNGKITISVSSSTEGLLVEGMSTFNSSVNILKDVTVLSTATFSKKIILGNVEDIDVSVLEPLIDDQFNLGSSNKLFRTVHAKEIKGYDSNQVDTLHVYGTLYGPALQLITPRGFSLSGEIITPSVFFNGTSDVNLNSVITTSFINDKQITTSTADLRFIALDTVSNNYKSIDSAILLKEVVKTGSILLFPDTITVSTDEYLECDGSSLFPSEGLYEVLGGNGVDPIVLPNLSSIVNGDYTLKYFIKR